MICKIEIESPPPVKNTLMETVSGIARFIFKLCREGSYAVIEIQINDGDIILVRKQESFKPSAFLVEHLEARS